MFVGGFSPFSVRISHESAYGDNVVTVKNCSGRTFTVEFQENCFCKIVFKEKFFFVSFEKEDVIHIGISHACLIRGKNEVSIVHDISDDSKNRPSHLFFSKA